MKSFFLLIISVLTSVCLLSQTDSTVIIYFESNSYQVSEADQEELKHDVQSISERFSITKAVVNGFCDDVDSDEYNLTLSTNRALAVEQILQKETMLSDQKLVVNGKGELPLAKENKTNSKFQRAKNRKTEITFYLKPKTPPAPEVVSVIEPEPVEEVLEEVIEEVVPSYLEGDLEVGDKIILKGILFVGNQDLILEESLGHVESLLQELKDHPEVSIQIQGHIYDPYYYDPNFESPDTDNLSRRRAKKVYKYLKSNGIDKNRLSYIGFEGKYPLGGDPKFDRRVEIEIISID